MGLRTMLGRYMSRGHVAVGVIPHVYVWYRYNIYHASGLGIDPDAKFIENGAYLVLNILDRSNDNTACIARVLTPEGRVGFVEANALRSV
jgi:hypothetical protein